MKISLNTLKTLTQVKYKTTGELVEAINNQIADIKGVEDLSEKYKGILVGQIVKAAAHPDADKLGIFQIDYGAAEPVQVVAGDKSLKVGDKVAYFPPNTAVPYNPRPDMYDGIVRTTKLRGVVSNGMLASAKELDISNNHEQVLVLDTKAKPGTTLAQAYGLNDLILDVENKALTNRPECFGIVGFAREVAGIQGIKFSTPNWFSYTDEKRLKALKKTAKLPKDTPNRVTIVHQEQELCSRYMAVVFDDVKIKPSPVWLQVELAKAGIRPISNVVDITNYLMVMTGQPLHAFDMDKVVEQDKGVAKDNPVITIRRAKENEKLEMINGKLAELDAETLVIADSGKPVGIAGIMGGLPTEVGPNTKRVILESAAFNMYSIRKTSNRLGLTSDAVTRYSKNQDPQQCEAVVYKAVELFRELTGAKVGSKLYDSYVQPRKERKIKFSLRAANEFIGIKLTKLQAVKLLENVELTVKTDAKDADSLIVTIPTYRQDLNIIEDVYEELARLYGFTRIPLSLPTRSITPAGKNEVLEMQARVRELLAGYGATEVISYNFVSKELIENVGQELAFSYHLKNAMSTDLTYFRQSLMGGLLEKASANLVAGYDFVNLYEINKVHIKGEVGEDKLPYEFRKIALIYSAGEKAGKNLEGSPYYQAKIYLENLMKALHVQAEIKFVQLADVLEGEVKLQLPKSVQVNLNVFEPNSSALVLAAVDEQLYYLGMIGEVEGAVRAKFNLPVQTAGFEVDLEDLMTISSAKGDYVEPSKYPKAWRDLCFVVKSEVNYAAVAEVIVNELKDENMVSQLTLMDIYQKDSGSAEKQMTFRLALQSRAKPLKEKDIEYWVEKVVRSVEKTAGGKLKE